MNAIDELLREVLTTDANAHHPTADLATRSIEAGRIIRRRRRVGTIVVSVVSAVAMVAVSLAVASRNGSGDQVIQSANDGGGIAVPSMSVHATPNWSTWPQNRVFGSKPGSAFFADQTAGSSTLASGTLPDGMQFSFTKVPNSPQPVQGAAGVDDHALWGDQPGDGDPAYRPDAPYFGYELMTAATYDNGNEDRHGGFWVVIVGQPDTTAANFAIDGRWQAMQLEDGIAVIKVNLDQAGLPANTFIQLYDQQGPYAFAPISLL